MKVRDGRPDVKKEILNTCRNIPEVKEGMKIGLSMT
jgi:hypothetical protein